MNLQRHVFASLVAVAASVGIANAQPPQILSQHAPQPAAKNVAMANANRASLAAHKSSMQVPGKAQIGGWKKAGMHTGNNVKN